MRLSLSYSRRRPRAGRSRGRRRRAPAGIAALLAAALCASSPAPADGPGGASRARHLMGTRLTIEIPGPAPAAVFDAAFDEVARLEGILSNWRDTSEVSRLNRTAAGGWFHCSPELFAVLESALRWARRTDGAFDPTVEPLVRRLGIRGEEGRMPGTTPPAVDAATGPIGWRHVRLDGAARAARFDAAGVGIDLGGIGKGFALDRAAAVLRRRGVREALLDFGGQVLAIGPRDGRRSWEVGVADPLERERPVARVPLRRASLSTSANGGGRPGGGGPPDHILDPARGTRAGFAGSVTVRAPDGTTADALSTGLLVMGPERGVTWAREHGFEVLYLWREPGGALRHRATPWFETQLSQDPLHGRSAVSLH